MQLFKYGGKNGQAFKLIEAEDLVVVRTTESEGLRGLNLSPAAQELAAGMIPVLSFPESNVMVYRVVEQPGEESILKTRNAIRRSLTEEDQVRFAGRTLVDNTTKEIVIYTENIFVKFKDNVTTEKCLEIIGKFKLTQKLKFGFAENAFFLKSEVGTGMKVFDTANTLLDLPEVELCHPELVTERQSKAIHPMQWHLHKTNIGGQEVDQHIQVEAAWNVTKGQNVTIAIIDNGVDSQHEAFQAPGKIIAQRNTLFGVDDARPMNPFSRGGNHGTSCAGVAGADTPNGTQGVAPKASLMPIICGNLGSLSEADAFFWAAENGADIISCSWGPRDGPWWEPTHASHQNTYVLPDSTRLALDFATTQGRNGKGCVIFWAAGNGNESVDLDGYAAYEKVIAVAACNDRGQRSIYSDFGKAIWCCFPSDDFGLAALHHPEPITPGIWTTDISGAAGANRGGAQKSHPAEDNAGNYTTSFGGTSSACPGAAGVAALILSVNPALTREQVKDILRNACDRIDSAFGNYDSNGHSPFYGYGRLNAAKAIELAQATLAPELNFTIEGSVRFRNAGGKTLIPDVLNTSTLASSDRLMGLQLRVSPLQPDLGIQYKLFSSGGIKLEGADGQLAMQTDKRRKITGFSAKLTGNLASSFDLIYSLKLMGIDEPISGKNGTLCGKSDGVGAAIVAVQISVTKK